MEKDVSTAEPPCSNLNFAIFRCFLELRRLSLSSKSLYLIT